MFRCLHLGPHSIDSFLQMFCGSAAHKRIVIVNISCSSRGWLINELVLCSMRLLRLPISSVSSQSPPTKSCVCHCKPAKREKQSHISIHHTPVLSFGSPPCRCGTPSGPPAGGTEWCYSPNRINLKKVPGRQSAISRGLGSRSGRPSVQQNDTNNTKNAARKDNERDRSE